MRVDKGVYVCDFYVDEEASRKKCVGGGKRDLSPLHEGVASGSDGSTAEGASTAVPQGQPKA
eukprot:757961-Karenia_brevis.AAC.1